jgi:hypothetical protein
LKPYLLFAGDNYYPSGGWDDFAGEFDSADDAIAAFSQKTHDWGHVVSRATNQIVRWVSRDWVAATNDYVIKVTRPSNDRS